MDIIFLKNNPAGLSCSSSIKSSKSLHEITAIERNKANDTLGRDIVFSDNALEKLQRNDVMSEHNIRHNFLYWSDVDVAINNQRIAPSRDEFVGISRKKMLILLQECAKNDVEQAYTEMTNVVALKQGIKKS